MIQKIISTVMRCVGFLGCYDLLQDDTKDSSNCDAMCWFSGMLLSFVTSLQDGTKDNSNCDLMCWFFWDAMIFCNKFARWYKR